MKKTILVTGGLGFIGSNLIDYLLLKNYKIINVDKVSYSSNFYNTKNFFKNKNYIFKKCDLNNKIKMTKIFYKYKPEGVFNLAAETHVDRSIENSGIFFKSNVIGFLNLLDIINNYSKKNKFKKIIHVSTDEVYGDLKKSSKRSIETDKYYPSSPYAASKGSSDLVAHSYYKTFKTKIIVTNCSNNFGPNQHPEKLIPKIIFNIINNKVIPLYGSGKNSREWIYVRDHCKALYSIYIRGKIGEFYNIGSGINLNNLQITNMIIRLANNKFKNKKKIRIKFVKDRPAHDFKYSLNSNKIKKKLNFKFKPKFMHQLKYTFEWYINNKKYFISLNKKDITRRIGLND